LVRFWKFVDRGSWGDVIGLNFCRLSGALSREAGLAGIVFRESPLDEVRGTVKISIALLVVKLGSSPATGEILGI
jgi:hypothetical protein